MSYAGTRDIAYAENNPLVRKNAGSFARTDSVKKVRAGIAAGPSGSEVTRNLHSGVFFYTRAAGWF